MCQAGSRAVNAAGASVSGTAAYRISVSSTFISAVRAAPGTAMSGWRRSTQVTDSSTVRCARSASSCCSHQAIWVA
jgi:hypothetical protein